MSEQTAQQFLDAAGQHMQDRATTYDKPEGERSMAATVTAFAAITGHELTEEQGWLFMETLKLVRSQQGAFRADNYEDAVAYAALRGEAAAQRQPPEPDGEALIFEAQQAAVFGNRWACARCGTPITPGLAHECDMALRELGVRGAR